MSILRHVRYHHSLAASSFRCLPEKWLSIIIESLPYVLYYTGPPLIHASLIHDFGLFAVPTLAPEFSGTDRQNDAKKPTTMAMMFRQQDIAQQRFS